MSETLETLVEKTRKRFLVFTAMHGRPHITQLFCMNWQRIITDNPDFRFTLFAVVSDDMSETICKDYGWNYHRTDNYPVGNKFNQGLEQAFKHDFDYLIVAGSDDLASSELFKFIAKYRFWSRQDYFGVKSAYILSPEHSAAVEFIYPNQKLCGSYRFISRKALATSMYQVRVIAEGDFLSYKANQAYYMSVKRAEYLESVKHVTIVSKPLVRLWHPRQNKGLDMYSELILTAEGFFPYQLNVESSVVAIKCRENINSYEYVSNGSEAATLDQATSFLGDMEKSILRVLGAKF